MAGDKLFQTIKHLIKTLKNFTRSECEEKSESKILHLSRKWQGRGLKLTLN